MVGGSGGSRAGRGSRSRTRDIGAVLLGIVVDKLDAGDSLEVLELDLVFVVVVVVVDIEGCALGTDLFSHCNLGPTLIRSMDPRHF